MSLQAIKKLLKRVFEEWSEDNASRLAAALAYYTVFSLAPLIVLCVIAAAQLFDEELARRSIQMQIQGLVGQPGADVIEEIITNASGPTGGILATVIGLGSLLFGASGVFGELQNALNAIWDVPPQPSAGWLQTVKDRFFSFTMVLGVGFLLLISLIINSILSGISDVLSNAFPAATLIAYLLNMVVSFVVITGLFALTFKVIPDVVIQWQDVLVGAAVTAVLFMIGKWAIGFYLGQTATDSTFGAFGSLIALLAWVYYSAQILFLGAEFTQVYANQFGSHIVFENVAPKKPQHQEPELPPFLEKRTQS